MNRVPFWKKRRKVIGGSLETTRAKVIEKFEERRVWAGRVNRGHEEPTVPDKPTRVNAEQVRALMDAASKRADKAGVPRPRFPFAPGNVVAVYGRHREQGEGVWFRLDSGRVFRDTGDPESGDPALYD